MVSVLSSAGGEIGFKLKKEVSSVRDKVRRVRRWFSEESGSFMNKVFDVVDVKVDEWFEVLSGNLKPGKLYKPVDVAKEMSEGRVLIRVGEGVEEAFNVRRPGVEVLDALRKAGDIEREALGSLIGRGASKPGTKATVPLIKEAVEKTADDFGSFVY